MVVYVLREDAEATGTAYPRLKDVKHAALTMDYGEIVRADLNLRGLALHCALYNRNLGPTARVIGTVIKGKVLILNNHKPANDGKDAPAPEVEPAPA